MPHITAPLNLNDGLATPVARQFAPQLIGIDLSRFAYKKGLTKLSWVFLSVKWSDSTPKRPTVRQEVAIELPIIRTVNGVETRVAIGRAVTTFVIPDEMTEDEVKDLQSFSSSAVNGSTTAAGRVNREPIWG